MKKPKNNPNNDYQVFGVRWLQGTIGIVRYLNGIGEVKFAIGNIPAPGLNTQEEDTVYIAKHGNKINPNELIEFLSPKL